MSLKDEIRTVSLKPPRRENIVEKVGRGRKFCIEMKEKMVGNYR